VLAGLAGTSISESARAAPRQRSTKKATIVSQRAGMRKMSILGLVGIEVPRGDRARGLSRSGYVLYRTTGTPA
jgi:hypothetical protein